MKKIIFGFFLFMQIMNTTGQIIYTKISLPDTLRRGDTLTVDLNNDSLYDVSLFHSYYNGGSGCAPFQENINFGSVNYLQIFKDVNTGCPAIFNNGDTIKSDMNYQERACENDLNKPCFTIEKIIHEGCSYNIEYEGLYSDYSNKYFGLKFLINNEYHFAWLKFSQLKGGHIWFDSYAYDSQLNDYLVINDLYSEKRSSKTAENLRIYPNPVKDNIKILLDTQQSGFVKILNITGQLVEFKRIEDVVEINMNLFNLKSGVYTIILETKVQVLRGKILKI